MLPLAEARHAYQECAAGTDLLAGLDPGQAQITNIGIYAVLETHMLVTTLGVLLNLVKLESFRQYYKKFSAEVKLQRPPKDEGRQYLRWGFAGIQSQWGECAVRITRKPRLPRPRARGVLLWFCGACAQLIGFPIGMCASACWEFAGCGILMRASLHVLGASCCTGFLCSLRACYFNLGALFFTMPPDLPLQR